MASSKAATVAEYLAELPSERQEVMRTVRELVNGAVQPGFEEIMSFGMIGWVVPLSRYPTTYNRQPLAFVSLAAQKRHYALYLMCAYADTPDERRIADAFAAAGKRLDMGKSCLRFASLDEVPWEVIVEVLGRYSVDDWIRVYEASRAGR